MKSHPELQIAYSEQEIDPENNKELFEKRQFARAELEKQMLNEDNLKEIRDVETIPQDLLKKYIIYARRHVHPKLTEINEELVKRFYADIRQQS